MTIEFRCTNCQSLLRTKDETAGRQARCPSCGTVQQIPAVGAVPPVPNPPPVGGGPGENAPFQMPLPPGAAPAAPPGLQGMLPPQAPSSDNPYQSPLAHEPAGTAGWGAPGITPIAPHRVGVGEMVERTWSIFSKNWLGCTVAALIMLVCNILASLIAQAAQRVVMLNNANPATVLATMFGSQLLLQIVSTYLYLGMAVYAVRLARGMQPSLAVLFSGGRWLIRGLLGSLLFMIIMALLVAGVLAVLGIGTLAFRNTPAIAIALAVAAGMVAFVLAMYFLLGIAPAFYLIVDRDLGLLEAVSESWRIMPGNRLSFFLLGLLGAALIFAGTLACCVGIVPAMGFLMLSYGVAYLLMSGQRTVDMPGMGY